MHYPGSRSSVCGPRKTTPLYNLLGDDFRLSPSAAKLGQGDFDPRCGHWPRGLKSTREDDTESGNQEYREDVTRAKIRRTEKRTRVQRSGIRELFQTSQAGAKELLHFSSEPLIDIIYM